MLKNETILLKNHTNKDLINSMFELAKQGQTNKEVLRISEVARTIPNIEKRNKFIYESVYNLAVYRSSPENRQQLKTVDNITRTKKANCTGYTTVLASIFNNLKEPYKMRLVDTKGNGFDHIYLINNNIVLDCVLGQNQNEKDNFYNRIKNGLYNNEVSFLRKKDFNNMLTVVNGRVRSNRIKINGLFDTFADLLGDECKRECDIKHLSDADSRRACKEECESNVYTIPDVRTATGNTQSQTNTILIAGAVGLGVYLLTKKK
jgi:hypothetical protein